MKVRSQHHVQVDLVASLIKMLIVFNNDKLIILKSFRNNENLNYLILKFNKKKEYISSFKKKFILKKKKKKKTK